MRYHTIDDLDITALRNALWCVAELIGESEVTMENREFLFDWAIARGILFTEDGDRPGANPYDH